MGQWIEFATIKQSVSLWRVLDHYEMTAGLRRSGKDQWRGRCPLHDGEGRDAFHVNTARQWFHCFACGAGGTVLDLVAAIEHCGLRQAAQKLTDWGLSLSPASSGMVSLKEATVTKKRAALRALGFSLRGVDCRHPYLCHRGIRQQTATTFGVGFYVGPGLLSGRVVIPIHDGTGQLVAYVGRSLDGSQPRYQFPAGFPKSQVVFNLHRAAATVQRTVIVVEGFFDCLKVHQAGFPGVVALMGSALSDHQRSLITQRFRQIILMLDGDSTGRRASTVIATDLARHACVRTIELVAGAQPDQLSSHVIHGILAKKGGTIANC